MPVRIAKRSQEACAISKVPELSCGFMVPMQKNGRGSAWRRLPTVTACSSTGSSRPACMRGVARLNSSSTTAFANALPVRESWAGSAVFLGEPGGVREQRAGHEPAGAQDRIAALDLLADDADRCQVLIGLHARG